MYGWSRGIALHLVLERSVTTSKLNKVGTLPLHWLSMFPDKDIDSMAATLSYTENDNMFLKGFRSRCTFSGFVGRQFIGPFRVAIEQLFRVFGNMV